MVSATTSMVNPAEYPGLPCSYQEPHWYAAYTRSHQEKCVAIQLEQRSVEHFLPLYESVHQWKDRRVKLALPLFPGYVFVRLALRDRLQVLRIPSVARLVSFSDVPAALPEEEIEILRMGLGCGVSAQPHPYLTVGRKVLVVAGPLAGIQGILLRRKGNLRVVLSLNLIQRSIITDIDANVLKPLPDSGTARTPRQGK